MKSVLLFVAAALLEIAGCFAFWQWVRQGRSAWWLLPGLVLLAAFAWVLTKVNVPHAGRTYAIYGGIYIAASLLWLRAVEGHRPDGWDLGGAAICIAGALLMLYGPRG